MYAICGVGKWGTKILKEFHSSVEFKYFCCKSENTANKITQEFKFIKRASLEEICRDKEVTDVIVCVPIEKLSHFALKLLEHNKNIFLEKPGAESFEKIESIMKSCRSKVYVNYKFLNHPKIKTLKKEIEEGKKISSFSIDWQKYGSFNNDIRLNLLTHIISILKFTMPKEDFYMEYASLKDDSLVVRCYSQNCRGKISILRTSKNRKFLFFLEEKNGVTKKIDLNSENLLKNSVEKYLNKTNLEIGLDFSSDVLKALEKIRA